VSRCP